MVLGPCSTSVIVEMPTVPPLMRESEGPLGGNESITSIRLIKVKTKPSGMCLSWQSHLQNASQTSFASLWCYRLSASLLLRGVTGKPSWRWGQSWRLQTRSFEGVHWCQTSGGWVAGFSSSPQRGVLCTPVSHQSRGVVRSLLEGTGEVCPRCSILHATPCPTLLLDVRGVQGVPRAGPRPSSEQQAPGSMGSRQ